jgi:hypothetical protein
MGSIIIATGTATPKRWRREGGAPVKTQRKALGAGVVAIAMLLAGCAMPVTPVPAAAPTYRVLAEEAPYTVEEVRIRNTAEGITLAGSFYRPRGQGPFPAAVIITGSLPDSRTYKGNSYTPLAEQLSRRGLAVLRMDDRGVGGSGGVYRWSRYADFVTDIVAELDYLKGRPEIDPARVGLVGHSEGGMIAPLVASRYPVAFVVLLAAGGVTGAEIAERQSIDKLRSAGFELSSEDLARMRAARLALQADDKPIAMFKDLLRLLAPMARVDKRGLAYSTLQGVVRSAFAMAFTPWYRDFLHYNPRQDWPRVKAPVLVLNGNKDIFVAPDLNVTAIRQALAAGGNPNVTVTLFPGLNHVFKPAKTGALEEYRRPGVKMDPAVPKLIAEWVMAQKR